MEWISNEKFTRLLAEWKNPPPRQEIELLRQVLFFVSEPEISDKFGLKLCSQCKTKYPYNDFEINMSKLRHTKDCPYIVLLQKIQTLI